MISDVCSSNPPRYRSFVLLTCQEHAAFQGVSEYDFRRFNMHTVEEHLVKKMAGDALLGFRVGY